jgi:type I phosphodiesterase/nucleotide pyrophosphatase
MPLDDLVLRVQRRLDRVVRRLRLGRAPVAGRRRLLIVQIDGLSRSVLQRGLDEGHMPFLRRLLERGGCRMHPMSVGLPTSTPAFQMSAMYGVPPDIPGFHYHDKRRGADVYFPRTGDAAHVEATQAAGRLGIVTGGSTYGCVFTGGAVNNLLTFTMLKRPSAPGLLRALSASVVLTWVFVKSLAISVVQIVRAVAGFVADPVGAPRGWKLLALKIAVSVWIRELFTLSTARDLYAGTPSVYVNYLDYDIFAHAWGPRHRRALRSLRAIDHSLRVLWRVSRRVPEHRYDIYLLADHGQAHCTPYQTLTGGRRVERLLFEEFLNPAGAHEVALGRPEGRRLASGIKAMRRRVPGAVQRFINYLEHDFPWLLGEVKEARQEGGVRVIAAGPNAFVYLLDDPAPVDLEGIEARFPGLAEGISRSRGMGFVLARSTDGPVCYWRGKRHGLAELGSGPFTGRADLDLVVAGIRDLMAMPSAGDLVLYGLEASEGHVSFINESGAHAGPTEDEMQTFIVTPPGVTLSTPITHPLQLYPHFVQYQAGA